MEGAPGHQADRCHRGQYRDAAARTWGGFERMTAQPGGVWDTLLAEVRRFRITSTSDSHRNIAMGGADLRRGRYSKIYVLARHRSADLVDGLRNSRMFAVTGNPIDTLDLQVDTEGVAPATRGGTLQAAAGAQLTVRVSVRGMTAPISAATQCDRPHRRDRRAGVRRRHAGPWQQAGNRIAFDLTLPAPEPRGFERTCGTSNAQGEPTPDAAGGDPWQDLRLSSNPAFVEVARRHLLWPGGLPPGACAPSATARTRGSAKSGM